MLRKSFLDMSSFTGSYKNIRYKYDKVTEDDKEFLKLSIWDKDIAFDNVDKSILHIEVFEYNDEGINKSIDFIDEYQKGSIK